QEPGAAPPPPAAPVPAAQAAGRRAQPAPVTGNGVQLPQTCLRLCSARLRK
ncbi:hypothetical protein Q9966_000502, partial [Columba livia]